MSRFSIKKLQKHLCSCRTPEQAISLTMKWEPRCQSAAEWTIFCTAFHTALVAQADGLMVVSLLSEYLQVERDRRRRMVLMAMISQFAVMATQTPLVPTAALVDSESAKGADADLAALRFNIRARGDVNASLESGLTALHLYAYMEQPPWSNPRAIRLLLDAGAIPNARTESGITPLLVVCDREIWTREASESAAILLARGADPTIEDEVGSSPLSCLRRWQSERQHIERDHLIARLQKMMEEPILQACQSTQAVPKHAPQDSMGRRARRI